MLFASLAAALALAAGQPVAAPAPPVFPRDATFLSTLTPEVTSVEKVGDATLIHLTFTLPGCIDQLGPVQYELHFDPETGKHVLSVGGIDIHTRRSEVTRCFVAPRALRTITVQGDAPSSLRDLVVQSLETLETL